MIRFGNGEGRRGSRPLAAVALALLTGVFLLAGCAGNRSAPRQAWSGVAVGDGAVYVGTLGGRLIPLSAATGAPGAPFEAPEGERSSPTAAFYATPAFANGRIYAGGYNGVVYSLRADDMSDLRTFEIDGNSLTKGIAGSIVVSGGRVVFGAAEGAQTGRLYVLNASTMQEVCRYPRRGDEPVGKIWSTATVVGGTAYFGDLSHRLHAVSIEDCTSRWEAPVDLGGGITATPLVVDGKVFIGTFDRSFYEVSVRTGSATKLFSADRWFWAGAATDGTRVFAPSMDGHLYAMDIDSRSLVWTYPREGDVGPIVSTPVVVGDQVAFGSDNENLIVVGAADGVLAWEWRAGDKIRAPITADGSIVYVRSLNNRVSAFDLEARPSERSVWSPVDLDSL